MVSWGTLPPLTPEFYTLLRYSLFLLLLIHLPFLGGVIGGSAVSLLSHYLGKEKRDPAFLRFSREVMEFVLFGKSALVVFLALPIVLAWGIFERILFEATPLPFLFWAAILALLFAGIAVLHLYRAAWKQATAPPPFHIGTGGAGLLAVLLAFFLFSSGYGILFNPEKLPFLREKIHYLVSWNAVVKFLQFLVFFLGMTGAGILLAGGPQAGEKGGADAEYRGFVVGFGSALTFLATLAFPVLVLLDLITLPTIALSAEVFAISAAVLLLSLTVCLVLSRFSGREDGGAGRRVIALYALIFLALLLRDHAALGNASDDRIALMTMQAKAAGHVAEGRLEEPAGGVQAAAETGRAVFEKRCAGCHQFDSRVVGPPLAKVVPKYGGDAERLKGFLRNPVKVDPDYPSMPMLGLPEEEIDAVARYLIERSRSGGSS